MADVRRRAHVPDAGGDRRHLRGGRTGGMDARSEASMTLPKIVAMMILAHLAFVTTRMTGSLYALAHNASTFTVGVQMALFALVPMLVAVPVGRWLDASGPRRPLLTGFLMILAGATLPVLFPFAVADVAPLLVAAPLAGTGMMLVQMTTQSLVGELAKPGRRAEAFSWL